MHYELSVGARDALQKFAGQRFPLIFENTTQAPPQNGGMYIKFDYMEASSDYVSLNRKCRVFEGLVQLSIVFSPGVGVDNARQLAREMVEFFEDGKDLSFGYISQGAESKPVLKDASGWLIPVRFVVRYDKSQKE